MNRKWTLGLLTCAVACAAAMLPLAHGADGRPAMKLAATAGNDPNQVKLTMAPLPPTALVYTASEASPRLLTTAATPMPRPGNALEFGKSRDSVEFTLAGTSFRMLRQGTNFALATEKKTAVLPRLNAGLAPIELPLGPGRRYPIQFPEAYTEMVFYRSGALMKGSLGGQNVAIYDANADGAYTTSDAIRFDDGASSTAVFAPLSKLVPTRNGIYEIKEIAEDGVSLTVAPHEGKTVKLKVSPGFDSGELAVAIGSHDADLNFVATMRGRPVEISVLPGSYGILYGVAFVPGKGVVATVNMPKAVKVEQDQTLELGKPFAFDFKATRAGGKITVNPGTFSLKGKAGETYHHLAYAAMPEISLILDGRSIVLGRMEFGWSGSLCAYSGGVPANVNLAAAKEVKIGIVAQLQGFGIVKGTTDLVEADARAGR